MPHDNYQQFVVLFFFGLGLVLASISNLMLRRAGGWKHAAASLAAVGGTLAACHAFENDSSLLEPLAAVLLAVLTPVWALSTIRGSGAASWLIARIHRPLAAWRFCALAGVAVIVGSAARFQDRDDRAIEADLAEVASLEIMDRHRSLEMVPAAVHVSTDRGNEIALMRVLDEATAEQRGRIEDEQFRRDRNRDVVIRRSRADSTCNCFGWIFTGGKFWLPGPEQIELILQENGYHEPERPRPGDLVVYRRNGSIVHVAIVRYTARNQPVLVEGKWGPSGVYLHAADQSAYGNEFTYMRSPRSGHLLAGLESPEPLAQADEESD